MRIDMKSAEAQYFSWKYKQTYSISYTFKVFLFTIQREFSKEQSEI
jgi:hypothetical protein